MLDDRRTIGLALSGGGFRATLFSLGSLWRMNELGLLQKLDRITSVSGGSILAGVLAHRWSKLSFVNGVAGNFVAEIADPVRDFCNQTVDVKAVVLGGANPFKTAGDYLVGRYAKDLFGSTKMSELPDARQPGNPKFIFYATNLQTGRSFRFRQDMLADYVLGTSTETEASLAFAVGASSAFPPLFSPLELETSPESWSGEKKSFAELRKLRRKIVLTDGGVYDNMGLESLLDNVDVTLVSDAGAPMEIDEDPHGDPVRQMGRVRDILIEQTRALRKRWLVEDFKAGRKQGAYWGVGTRIEDYEDTATPFKDTTETGDLVSVPTRLAPFPQHVQVGLINWGYALCDVALRRRAGLPVPPAARAPL